MNEHLINHTEKAIKALEKLNILGENKSQTLFVLNKQKLVGTLTDGDVRRGLLRGHNLSSSVNLFMNIDFKFINQNQIDLDTISSIKKLKIKLLPILDDQNRIVELIDLSKKITKLPVSAVLMAGGLGSRLRPLTNNTPKPMLTVGDKPIIEHNIDRLIEYGIDEIYISVNYLKEQIIDYFGDGTSKGVSIKYIIEDRPMGTIGALSMIKKVSNSTILLMNSDILTDANLELMYRNFIKSRKKMMILSIPYTIDIPYAVIETIDDKVLDFKEKPSITYHTNGGMYLLNSSSISKIPKNSFYNATDLMQKFLNSDLVHYSHKGNWIDIGRPEDFKLSQELFN